ncbi:MAG: sigma factor, partial [Acidimicrobiales bacterium]
MRRKGDVGRHRRVAALDQLIAQLEGGSASAGDRLIGLVRAERADERRQRPQSGSELAADGGVGPGDRLVLDAVARSASGGSARALELLLGLIVEHDLAGPAIDRLLTGPARADVEQDVLVAVTRSIHRFRGEARFTTWLYSLARNVTIAHLRRTR